MQLFNSLLAFLVASFLSSLVAASPLGRLSNEKRQFDDNVVWVTVTSVSTVIVHTHIGQPHHVTKVVTVHASFVEPPQRGAPFTPAIENHVPVETPSAVENPAVEEPAVVTAAPSIPKAPAPAVVSLTTPVVSSTTPVASPSESPVSPGSGTFSGQGTYYSTGMGSCGVTSADSDYICAISHGLYDSVPDGGNPNNSPFCGRKITAYRGSSSVVVTVVDRCTGCATYDLDFSPSAFDQLTDPSEGRVDITWEWLS